MHAYDCLCRCVQNDNAIAFTTLEEPPRSRSAGETTRQVAPAEMVKTVHVIKTSEQISIEMSLKSRQNYQGQSWHPSLHVLQSLFSSNAYNKTKHYIIQTLYHAQRICRGDYLHVF